MNSYGNYSDFTDLVVRSGPLIWSGLALALSLCCRFFKRLYVVSVSPTSCMCCALLVHMHQGATVSFYVLRHESAP